MAFTSGLPAHFSSIFHQLGQPELTLGRVVHDSGGLVRVQTSAQETSVCSARRGEALAPVTGDWVAIERAGGVIEHVLPRHNEFSRHAPGRATARQTLAANVDWVFILMSLDGDFSVRRIERYLTLCHASRTRAVVFLTKADACGDVAARVARVERVAPQTPVHAIDVVAGIDAESPHQYLGKGATAAVLGSSGVGKSTLVNALVGRCASATQAVRKNDDKGRHTTSGRALFLLENGAALIDTPGLRELALWADAEDVHAAFPDVHALTHACRFRDCHHGSEPGCALRSAGERGEIAETRLESYRKLLSESEAHGARRMQHARRARGREIARAARDIQTRKYGRRD
ncbi:MAG TPA: ribosome small subunit-dependent GTPase A [Polyangiaceae bacterium]|nr:ribosome small subunit-dependent GTPase A [Polyangiaceae bacterium]